MPKFEEIKIYLQQKTKYRQGIFYYLPSLTDFQKKEINFHDKIHQDEEEIHQLNTVRNKFYHNYFKKYLYKLPKNSIFLEIGSGSGYDALDILKKGYNLIISDISSETIKSIKDKIDCQFPQYKNQVIYLVADGQNLPFKNNLIDAVFMVASLHHFENQQDLISETNRILKKDGLMIFAMEPSKFMMRFTKLFTKSKSLRIHNGHSEADETHLGYSKKDFKSSIINNQSLVIKAKRVWLTLGFLHYALEAIFRLFKLKKRIKIFKIIEWILLIFDEFLLYIPLINKLNWHWIVVYKK